MLSGARSKARKGWAQRTKREWLGGHSAREVDGAGVDGTVESSTDPIWANALAGDRDGGVRVLVCTGIPNTHDNRTHMRQTPGHTEHK